MKLLDKQGKLFGKIHLVDTIFIILIIILVISVIKRSASGNVKVFNGNSHKVKVELTVETYAYREEYLQSLNVGDEIAEDKKYLDGKITDINIIDDQIALTDNNGDVIIGAHPFKKKGRIIIEVQADKNGNSIKMGKQELVVGSNLFLTTEKSDLSTKIMNIEVIE
ncbi:DUF4330 domain-containing protein [Vallitalea guaymasensis]|mgnify:CR=1 FL=1|uniref:DUF4330 domain-containing protein n=1 Tax=Vallitalea guaymasensis TaxID=1185412 RepID=UPI00235527F4|nr:DUF4330 domain-containing protein [Vallitalea guaymasensis]